MSGLPWYAHSIKAYEDDTNHLSMLQHGAYRLMLDHYYKKAAPLPADAQQVHRICRAVADDEKAAVLAVLSEFFTLEADGWHNDKADRELAKMADISNKRRNSANSRHGKVQTQSNPPATDHAKPSANGDANNHANAHANADTLNTEHISSLRSDISPGKSKPRKRGEPDGFEEFYAAYPRKTARPAAAKAFAKAMKRAALAVIVAGARRYAEERAHEDPNFTKHPATWLNNDCWLDEPAPTKSFGGRNGGHHKPAQQSAISAISEAFSERNSDRPGDDVPGRAEIIGLAGPADQGRADEAPSLFGSPAADAA